MKNGLMNIRAYRVSESKGKINYVSKVDDDAEGIWFTSLEEMAMFLKHEAELFHSEFRPIRVEFVIDFRPFHDIEHASGKLHRSPQ